MAKRDVMKEETVWPSPKLVLRHVFGKCVELDAVDEKERPPKRYYPGEGVTYDRAAADQEYARVSAHWKGRRAAEAGVASQTISH